MNGRKTQRKELPDHRRSPGNRGHPVIDDGGKAPCSLPLDWVKEHVTFMDLTSEMASIPTITELVVLCIVA